MCDLYIIYKQRIVQQYIDRHPLQHMVSAGKIKPTKGLHVQPIKSHLHKPSLAGRALRVGGTGQLAPPVEETYAPQPAQRAAICKVPGGDGSTTAGSSRPGSC